MCHKKHDKWIILTTWRSDESYSILTGGEIAQIHTFGSLILSIVTLTVLWYFYEINSQISSIFI